MANQKITPIGKRVLVKEKASNAYYPGTTIMIPETQREKTYQAYVVAVGKEVEGINKNDLVQYVDYATPITMMHNGEKHLLITQADILAVIHE